VADKIHETVVTPQVGMAFQSENDAYDMYNTYIGKVGFSIRKSTTKYKSNKSLFKKYIVCSSQGYRQTESSKDIIRSYCTACIQFNVSREGVWTVQKCVREHNHYLASNHLPRKVKREEKEKCCKERYTPTLISSFLTL
jgi:zinc finger SWIM domain-containing protein 3